MDFQRNDEHFKRKQQENKIHLLKEIKGNNVEQICHA
jgi:hypothetical protein